MNKQIQLNQFVSLSTDLDSTAIIFFPDCYIKPKGNNEEGKMNQQKKKLK